MSKKIKTVFGWTVAVIIFTALLWLGLFPPSIERENAKQLPGTDLTVLEVETTFYGSESVDSRSGYYLLSDVGDTLAFQWVPYESVDGIVYMREKGVFDCRGRVPQRLLENDEHLGMNFVLTAIEGEEKVLIRNVHTLKEYVYDLKTNELSEK